MIRRLLAASLRVVPIGMMTLALGVASGCAVVAEGFDAVTVVDAAGNDVAQDTNTRDVRDGGGMDVPSTGCTADRDCSTGTNRICDMSTGTCVQCLPAALTATCPVGSYCTSTQTCAPGCGRDSDCGRGTDGGVPDGGSGDGGVRTVLCDVASHTCTRCLSDAECPLGAVCSVGRCVAGCSTTHGCQAGATCCSGQCYSTNSDPMHCGSCTTTCNNVNGVATCTAGSCSIACNSGFGNCDGNATNGCETNTTSNMTNCGMCGAACAPPHGMGVCLGGVCAVTGCAAGFQDCDHDPSNGCEVDTQSDPLNCGRCSRSCPTMMACVAGACTDAPLYHGWTCPIAGCITTSYNTMAATNLGGQYPFNTGDSNACRAWKLAATVCTTQPTMYSDMNNWTCPESGGFTDPVFGTYCRAPSTQYACSTCPGACNATCVYTPLSLRNCSGAEASQP